MQTHFKKILVISDNSFLTEEFIDIIDNLNVPRNIFTFYCSYNNKSFPDIIKSFPITRFNIKRDFKELITQQFDLIFSLHCKQLFPSQLVNSINAINVHPGFNPYNRGWFPQVFSIINGFPLGATIHIIDEDLDHGPIIDQQEVIIESWDTSLSAYNKVIKTELILIRRNLLKIINNEFITYQPVGEGNINLKKDYNALCELDLEEKGNLRFFLNKLRALTHGSYKNAFFYDYKSGKKVFIEIKFNLDDDSNQS